MGRLCLSSAAALISLLAIPAFNRPTAALTSAEGTDSTNAHPNVGVIMVWRDANNPLGLPGGLATYVTAVLIHPQTLLTAGHFAARLESVAAAGQLPPWLRVVASFAPNAFDQSHLDRAQSRTRHVLRSPVVSEALYSPELPVRRHRRPV